MNPPGKFSQASGCFDLLLAILSGTRCYACGKRGWTGYAKEYVDGEGHRDLCNDCRRKRSTKS